MRKIVIILALLCMLPLGARKQWTEKQAWAWEKRTGVIKGFNSPTPPYPGMTEEEVMRKAAELGYNSLRWWYGGPSVRKSSKRKETQKPAIHKGQRASYSSFSFRSLTANR